MKEKEIYEDCFENLTKDEEYCARMCQSMVIYHEGLGGYSDKQYLSKYRRSLGNNRIEEIYHTLEDYIKNNCEIIVGVHTDSEGVTYNSCIRKIHLIPIEQGDKT